ncbi:3'-5' exonuclease [Mycolicibacterium boenickei]|nr:3'-5' exonuclease [Mycolicibacterium boenickei]
MSERELIVVDVETTGLDVDKHWVLEVAAINVLTGEELCFVPSLPVGALDQADGKAMKINGYFARDVYALRLGTEASWRYWLKLWDWLDGNTLAGSNPTFDAAMLNRSMQLCHASLPTGYGKPDVPEFKPSPWHHRLADLSAYAAGALGIRATALPGLDVVCRSLKVENTSPHSALGDARATADCFRKLANTAAAEGVLA